MRAFHCLAGLLLSVVCATSGVAADEYIIVPLELDNIATNAAAQATNTYAQPLYGYIDTITIDLAGHATPTVDVDVVTQPLYGMYLQRTVFSADNLTADATYLPRVEYHNTGGTTLTNYSRIFLCGDKLQLKCSGSATNSTDVKVRVGIVR